jgi:hypothetical protein
MKQAITGVAPAELSEVTVMTVWPSIAANKVGQVIGSACMVGGRKTPFAPGKFLAILMIPVAVAVFVAMLLPWSCRRYWLTNRRVVVKKGLPGVDERFVQLDRFDAVEVVVLPGQAWYPAGELVFKLGGVETFRLSGVPRPATFRETCLKARHAYVLVQKHRT